MRPPFCKSSQRLHHSRCRREDIGRSPAGSENPLTRPPPLEPGLQVIDTRCWPHPSRVPSSHGWTPLLSLHGIMSKHVRRACPVETDASMPYTDTQVLTCTLDAARRVRAHYLDDATAAAPMWERAHQLLDGLEGQPTASPHRGPRGACQGVRNVVGKATGCWRRDAGRVEAHPDATNLAK